MKPIPSTNEIEFNKNEFIVSKTDTKGKIIYGNRYFIEISRYDEYELLGQPHSILRHPDMPKIIFKLLWEHIANRKEIFAYVKNLCKDGSYYWVFANVTATLNKNGEIRDYHSVRRKPSEKAMQTIPQLYEKLIQEERTKGIEGSYKLLLSILQEQGVDYDTFIFNLQF